MERKYWKIKLSVKKQVVVFFACSLMINLLQVFLIFWSKLCIFMTARGFTVDQAEKRQRMMSCTKCSSLPFICIKEVDFIKVLIDAKRNLKHKQTSMLFH